MPMAARPLLDAGAPVGKPNQKRGVRSGRRTVRRYWQCLPSGGSTSPAPTPTPSSPPSVCGMGVKVVLHADQALSYSDAIAFCKSQHGEAAILPDIPLLDVAQSLVKDAQVQCADSVEHLAGTTRIVLAELNERAACLLLARFLHRTLTALLPRRHAADTARGQGRLVGRRLGGNHQEHERRMERCLCQPPAMVPQRAKQQGRQRGLCKPADRLQHQRRRPSPAERHGL